MRFAEITKSVKTDNFKKWFTGSKVVDSNGNPLIVFHGTFEDFKVFKLESEQRRAHSFNRLGFWFDVDPETPSYFASGYSKTDIDNGKTITNSANNNIIMAFLSIKKPLIFSSEPVWHEDEKVLAGFARANEFGKFNNHTEKMDRQDSFNHLLKTINPSWNKKNEQGQKVISSHDFELQVEQFRQNMISEGYDGIVLEDTYADAGTRSGRLTNWWIAFKSSQIKSVYGNNGSFDPNNDDITESNLSLPVKT